MDLLPQSLHAVLFDVEADEHFLTLASSYRNLSGGGRARNRRRKSIAIGIYDHLIGRLTDHSELLDLVRARRAEVLSSDFEATQSTCLFNEVSLRKQLLQLKWPLLLRLRLMHPAPLFWIFWMKGAQNARGLQSVPRLFFLPLQSPQGLDQGQVALGHRFPPLLGPSTWVFGPRPHQE